MFDGKLFELLPPCGVFGVGGLDCGIYSRNVVLSPVLNWLDNNVPFVVHFERLPLVCQHELLLRPPLNAE